MQRQSLFERMQEMRQYRCVFDDDRVSFALCKVTDGSDPLEYLPPLFGPQRAVERLTRTRRELRAFLSAHCSSSTISSAATSISIPSLHDSQTMLFRLESVLEEECAVVNVLRQRFVDMHWAITSVISLSLSLSLL